MYVINIVIYIIWDRGMRNWNGDIFFFGFCIIRFVFLVIKGFGKFIILDCEGVIWKGVRVRLVF